MSLKEHVVQEIDRLPEAELQQVAEYVAFLHFKSYQHESPQLSPSSLAALYAEFADEDRELAEAGMKEYAEALAAEDAQ